MQVAVTKPCSTFCHLMDCSTLGSSVLQHLLEFAQIMSIELVIPSNHFVSVVPFSPLPSIFPSIRVFPKESLHQVAKVLEFQLQH